MKVKEQRPRRLVLSWPEGPLGFSVIWGNLSDLSGHPNMLYDYAEHAPCLSSNSYIMNEVRVVMAPSLFQHTMSSSSSSVTELQFFCGLTAV